MDIYKFTDTTYDRKVLWDASDEEYKFNSKKPVL